jgi:hypothetical protein
VADTRVDLELEGIINPTGMCSQKRHGHVCRVAAAVIRAACASHGHVSVRHVKACSQQSEMFVCQSTSMLAGLPRTLSVSRDCLWLIGLWTQ